MFRDKLFVAGALTVLLLSGAPVIAQQGPGGPGMPGDQQQMQQRRDMMEERMRQRREMMEQRRQQTPSNKDEDDESARSYGPGYGCMHRRAGRGQGPGFAMMGQGMMGRGMMGPGMMGPGMMGPGMMGPGMMRMMLILMDNDGDGSLSLQEFQAGHERIFKAVDANKDGQVTLEEFQSFISARPAQQQ